jgi:hypothetical protein
MLNRNIIQFAPPPMVVGPGSATVIIGEEKRAAAKSLDPLDMKFKFHIIGKTQRQMVPHYSLNPNLLSF